MPVAFLTQFHSFCLARILITHTHARAVQDVINISHPKIRSSAHKMYTRPVVWVSDAFADRAGPLQLIGQSSAATLACYLGACRPGRLPWRLTLSYNCTVLPPVSFVSGLPTQETEVQDGCALIRLCAATRRSSSGQPCAHRGFAAAETPLLTATQQGSESLKGGEACYQRSPFAWQGRRLLFLLRTLGVFALHRRSLKSGC